MSDHKLEVENGFGRRELLVGATATGLALALPFNAGAKKRQRRRPYATEGAFLHGVSSGLPSPRATTVWTRVTGLDRSSRLTLEVAADRGFRHVVERRQVIADSRNDYTVHARVEGLKPARQYFYRFHTKRTHSRVGRFRTLPPSDSKQPIKVGFYSCQAYEAGYYTAHASLALEDDLDLVICLGDYIYEHVFYEGPADRVDETGVNRDGNVQTLAEYRQKYRFYQSDRNLQELHAAHPFVAIWDDHEVEDNYNSDGTSPAQKDPKLDNSDTPRRVPFSTRQRNGYRAFFESMPRIRNRKDGNRIFGSLKLGGVAELFLTDQRQYRDRQPCGDTFLVPCTEHDDPSRTMLGNSQKQWLKKAIPASSANWKLWGSQVMVMALDLPAGSHANPDQWDGYAAERSELLKHFDSSGVENLAVLSGDIHTIFAGNLSTTGDIGGKPLGVEFGGGSMTSLGIPDAVGIPPSTLQALVPAADPHIKFADFEHRGYGVVTATKKDLTCEVKAVESALTRTSKSLTLAKFRVDAGKPELIRI